MPRLAFSNIAWTPHDDPEVLALLRSHGIQGIEVAPTKVWPAWEGATPQAARAYARSLADQGFEVPALQAVLFGAPQALLFGADGARVFRDHLAYVATLAAALGAKAVVLGAPKQRDRGALSEAAAIDLAVPVLRELGQIYADCGTCLCIEPNPRNYACNFIFNATQGAALVEAVDHPGFQLHLDAAGMFLEGDDLAALWPRVSKHVRHFHISEPELGDFRESRVPHAANFRTLEEHGYRGWCSVEMRESPLGLKAAGPWAHLPASSNHHS